MNNASSKLPKWLPQAIREHVLRRLKAGELGHMDKCLMALATNLKMKSVWASLTKTGADPDKLVEYLDYVFLHLSVVYPDDTYRGPSVAEQRKALVKIAQSSKQLIEALGSLTEANNPHSGLFYLSKALSRVASQAASKQDYSLFQQATDLGMQLNPLENAGEMVQTLTLIQRAAELARDAPSNAPTKQKAVNANRTRLIQELSEYVNLNFSQPLNQVVATTVNVALGLDDKVTESLVRKLVARPKKPT